MSALRVFRCTDRKNSLLHQRIVGFDVAQDGDGQLAFALGLAAQHDGTFGLGKQISKALMVRLVDDQA